MSLLALEEVSKRYREGKRERTVLDSVSLTVEAGEFVAVYGARRSGRTTLLRIAAGIELPDSGQVLLDGKALSGQLERALGTRIGYVQKTLRASEEQGVLEQIAAPLLARGMAGDAAQERARDALARSGAQHASSMRTGELSSGERIRVALARALSLSPAVLVIDDPAGAVELAERDPLLASLRGLARDGTAVLMSTSEPDELAGAHRALTLADGQLRGPARPCLAPVVPMRRGA